LNQENQTKPKTFQVGDTVTWTSQAGGNAKTKTGKVVAMIKSNELLSSALMRLHLVNLYRWRHLAESIRDHESYLIQVGKSKRLYWPLVKYLKLVLETFMLPSEDSEEGNMLKAKSKSLP
jgi:hypothetical protein